MSRILIVTTDLEADSMKVAAFILSLAARPGYVPAVMVLGHIGPLLNLNPHHKHKIAV